MPKEETQPTDKSGQGVTLETSQVLEYETFEMVSGIIYQAPAVTDEEPVLPEPQA